MIKIQSIQDDIQNKDMSTLSPEDDKETSTLQQNAEKSIKNGEEKQTTETDNNDLTDNNYRSEESNENDDGWVDDEDIPSEDAKKD